MILNILQHTPLWVYALLLVLIVLGRSQAVTRSVTLRRSAVLPVVLLILSLAGVGSTFGPAPAALAAWAAGVFAIVALLHGRVDTSRVRYSPTDRRLHVPGSGWPLALMLALFALKYGVAVALAIKPGLRETLGFALAISAAYGVFSGAFLARAMALWLVARRTQAVQAA